MSKGMLLNGIIVIEEQITSGGETVSTRAARLLKIIFDGLWLCTIYASLNMMKARILKM